MPDMKLNKTIQIHEDYVELHTGNFKFKSAVTDERDINGCVASCIEKVTNGGLSGVIIKDNRGQSQ